jgi:hypothetical protein
MDPIAEERREGCGRPRSGVAGLMLRTLRSEADLLSCAA